MVILLGRFLWRGTFFHRAYVWVLWGFLRRNVLIIFLWFLRWRLQRRFFGRRFTRFHFLERGAIRNLLSFRVKLIEKFIKNFSSFLICLSPSDLFRQNSSLVEHEAIKLSDLILERTECCLRSRFLWWWKFHILIGKIATFFWNWVQFKSKLRTIFCLFQTNGFFVLFLTHIVLCFALSINKGLKMSH